MLCYSDYSTSDMLPIWACCRCKLSLACSCSYDHMLSHFLPNWKGNFCFSCVSTSTCFVVYPYIPIWSSATYFGQFLDGTIYGNIWGHSGQSWKHCMRSVRLLFWYQEFVCSARQNKWYFYPFQLCFYLYCMCISIQKKKNKLDVDLFLIRQ